MAKRNRYRELENLMTKVILGDAAIFILYLIFAWKEIVALKVITAMGYEIRHTEGGDLE